LIAPFDGRAPSIDADAWIAGNATVVGAVTIANSTSIRFGAVLRADSEDIRIGAQTNVHDNCVLHADPGFPVAIGERVSIGHGAVVDGCTIEPECSLAWERRS
jgi:carbonic anhydrase/acetyltransferase-like protein (isoleucine patch superfamily)